MIYKIAISAVTITLCMAVNSGADTIYLKNGRSIEGIIGNEGADSVNLEVNGGSISFQKSEIEKIERSEESDSELLRRKWEKDRKARQESIAKKQLEERKKPKGVEFSSQQQQIILNVTLNKNVEAKLILDTGASLVVLSKKIAAQLGIDTENTRPDMEVKVADGRNVLAKRFMLESIKASGAEEDNVEAAFMLDEVGSMPGVDGLLGMSFLKRFNFKIDHNENKLILEKR